MRLATIAGIEVRAHASALFVFGMVAAVIAYGYLPETTPASSTAERIAVAFLASFLLFASLGAHEIGHALVARRRGHHVTSVTLYLLGGIAQISERGMKPADEMAIAAAGPAVSALLALGFTAAGIVGFQSSHAAGALLIDIGIANALLAAVNVLPGLPMDGGRVLRGFLIKAGTNPIAATRRAASVGKWTAYVITALGVYAGLRSDVFDGLWGVAIGWFLAGLSQSYYRNAVLRYALEGLTARDLCARDLPVLQTTDTVAHAMLHFGLGARTGALAVLFGERVAGLVTDVDAARVPQDQAETTTVATIMTRVGEQTSADPDADALDILDAMTATRTSAVIVDDEGTYVGLVRREDVMRYVEMVEALCRSTASDPRVRRLAKEAGERSREPDPRPS